MDHDLFQICRADRKPGGKSCILRADERVQLALVAACADEPCAQCRAAGGVRPLYGQIRAGQRLLLSADGDTARLDVGDRVGTGIEVGRDVRGEEDRHALLLAERQERVQQLVARDGVEAGRRLVENQQLRLVRHRNSQLVFDLHALGQLAHALALVQRKLPDEPRVAFAVPAGIEVLRHVRQLPQALALVI